MFPSLTQVTGGNSWLHPWGELSAEEPRRPQDLPWWILDTCCHGAARQDLWESHSLSMGYQRKADIFSLVWVTTCVTWDKASSFSRLGVLFGEMWVSATPTPWNRYQDGT